MCVCVCLCKYISESLGCAVVQLEHGDRGRHLLSTDKDKDLSLPLRTAAAGNNGSWRGRGLIMDTQSFRKHILYSPQGRQV